MCTKKKISKKIYSVAVYHQDRIQVYASFTHTRKTAFKPRLLLKSKVTVRCIILERIAPLTQPLLKLMMSPRKKRNKIKGENGF